MIAVEISGYFFFKPLILGFSVHFEGLCTEITSKTLKQERVAPFQACVAMYLIPSF